jgi:hypothetical protein
MADLDYPIFEIQLSCPSVNMLNWFSLPNPVFCNFFEFPAIKSNQNPISSHLRSENYEKNSIKSDSTRAFQQYQKCPQIPI